MLDLSTARHSPALVPSAFVRPLPDFSRYVLRGSPRVMGAAGAALGLNISDIACRSASQANRAALWLGPDEQLLLFSVDEGPAIATQLQGALATLPHSLVDVSHRQIAFEVAGALAQTVLNAGCPLDLHPASFPVGMCTRTVLGKADIVLWRTGADMFHIEVWRSFADYASRFLAEAARDLPA
jgi:sarcosine oxidase, subunit gamma